MGGGFGIWLAVMLTFSAATIVLLADDLFAAWIPASITPYLAGFREQLGSLWVLLLSGTVLMVLGLIDDIRGLSWKLRLTVQCLVALACVMSQQWYFTAFIPFKIITIICSVFWIVMLINSFNMLDNMDGASAGVAAIAALVLTLFVLLPGSASAGPQLFIAGFLLVLLGSLAGFLLHNRPPARIFMGDAGAYFVGFSIGIASLLATYASAEKPHAVLAPLCVLAIPIYDFVTVIFIRLREGRSPFEADKCHFTHRLVELGMSKGQAVLTIYFATATCGLCALLLPRVDSFAGASIIVLLVVCVLGE